MGLLVSNSDLSNPCGCGTSPCVSCLDLQADSSSIVGLTSATYNPPTDITDPGPCCGTNHPIWYLWPSVNTGGNQSLGGGIQVNFAPNAPDSANQQVPYTFQCKWGNNLILNYSGIVTVYGHGSSAVVINFYDYANWTTSGPAAPEQVFYYSGAFSDTNVFIQTLSFDYPGINRVYWLIPHWYSCCRLVGVTNGKLTFDGLNRYYEDATGTVTDASCCPIKFDVSLPQDSTFTSQPGLRITFPFLAIAGNINDVTYTISYNGATELSTGKIFGPYSSTSQWILISVGPPAIYWIPFPTSLWTLIGNEWVYSYSGAAASGINVTIEQNLFINLGAAANLSGITLSFGDVDIYST